MYLEGFECLTIELHCVGQSNTVCSVIYRHPQCNLESFSNYINSLIGKIAKEMKYCIIMGDFNVDLLKSNSHAPSEEFLNTMVSYFYQPHILQPTRITEHSATLIDNIYFNSIEHNTISGNLLYDIHLTIYPIFL